MKITFLFCQKMYAKLLKVKETFGFKTIGQTLLESISIRQIIQDESDLGFTEIYVRNNSGLQKKIILLSQK